MLDAYTLKKMLPRLVIAVVLVNVSWYICESLLTTTNVVGDTVRDLIWTPFRNAGYEHSLTITSKLDWLLGGAVIAGAIPFALWFAVGGGWAVILTTLLSIIGALLVAFAILTLREVGIVTMILISPIALVLWVLPGTEQWAKRWWGLFTKLLLMFPAFMALLAVGEVLSAVWSDHRRGDTSFVGGLLDGITPIVIYIIPFFLLPFLFKMMGGFIGQISGMINNKEKGLFDRSKNWSKQKQEGSHRGIMKKINKAKAEEKAQNRVLRKGTALGEGAIDPGGLRSRVRASRARKLAGYSALDTARSKIPGTDGRLGPQDMEADIKNLQTTIDIKIDKEKIERELLGLQAAIRSNPADKEKILEEFVDDAIGTGNTAAAEAAISHVATTGDQKGAAYIYDKASSESIGSPMRNAMMNAQNENHPNLKSMSPGFVGGFANPGVDTKAHRAAKIADATLEVKASMKKEAWDEYLSAADPAVKAKATADLTAIQGNENLKGKLSV